MPATAAPTTTTGAPAPPTLPLIRWDHLLLAMDVVSYLAQGPDQRGFSARAVNDVVWVRLGWLPRRGEAYDLFTQLLSVFRDLWAHRSPEGIEDHYNVAPFFEHLRLMPKTRPGERASDGFERLLRAIVTGEITEVELCEGESVSQSRRFACSDRSVGGWDPDTESSGQPVTRNDGGN